MSSEVSVTWEYKQTYIHKLHMSIFMITALSTSTNMTGKSLWGSCVMLEHWAPPWQPHALKAFMTYTVHCNTKTCKMVGEVLQQKCLPLWHFRALRMACLADSLMISKAACSEVFIQWCASTGDFGVSGHEADKKNNSYLQRVVCKVRGQQVYWQVLVLILY